MLSPHSRQSLRISTTTAANDLAEPRVQPPVQRGIPPSAPALAVASRLGFENHLELAQPSDCGLGPRFETIRVEPLVGFIMDPRKLACWFAVLFTGLAIVSAGAVAQAPAAAEMTFTKPAAERVALVIGNADYRSVARLDNPKQDAEAVAAALQKVGFDLVGGHALINLDKRG